jgi:hypothetical protein
MSGLSRTEFTEDPFSDFARLCDSECWRRMRQEAARSAPVSRRRR